MLTWVIRVCFFNSRWDNGSLFTTCSMGETWNRSHSAN